MHMNIMSIDEFSLAHTCVGGYIMLLFRKFSLTLTVKYGLNIVVVFFSIVFIGLNAAPSVSVDFFKRLHRVCVPNTFCIFFTV